MTVSAKPFLGLSFTIALLAVVSSGSFPCRADEQNPSVVVTRKGDTFVVDVVMFALVKQETAWEVLTDFDHMPDFLSNLSYSKTLRRDGSLLLVKQSGLAKYGIFSFAFESEREIRLEGMHHIYSRNVSGTARRMESEASLIQAGNGVQIRYHAEMVPDSALAHIFGKSFVNHEFAEQFRLMLDEMKRRERKS